MTHTEIMNDYRAKLNEERREWRRMVWSAVGGALIFMGLTLLALSALAGITCATLYGVTTCTDNGSTRTFTCTTIRGTTYCS